MHVAVACDAPWERGVRVQETTFRDRFHTSPRSHGHGERRPTAMRATIVVLAVLSTASALRLSAPLMDRRAAAKTILAGVAATVSLPALADDASIFIGRYTDPINHPGGYREINLLPTKLAGFQLAEVKGGGGRGEPASYTLPAMVGKVNGQDAITIDFSPKGGPRDFTGLFEVREDGTKGIRFIRDRNFWPMQ